MHKFTFAYLGISSFAINCSLAKYDSIPNANLSFSYSCIEFYRPQCGATYKYGPGHNNPGNMQGTLVKGPLT